MDKQTLIISQLLTPFRYFFEQWDWNFVLTLFGVLFPILFGLFVYFQDNLQKDGELRQKIAAQLRGHSWGNAYQQVLARALAWLDRVFGIANSVQALEVCMFIAVVYAYISFFLGWGLGGAGDIGGVELLPKIKAGFASAVSGVLLALLPVMAFFLVRWAARRTNRFELWIKVALLRQWRRYGGRRGCFVWTYRLLSGLVVGMGLWFLHMQGGEDMNGFWALLLLAFVPVVGGLAGGNAAHFASTQWRGIVAFLAGGALAVAVITEAGIGARAEAVAVVGAVILARIGVGALVVAKAGVVAAIGAVLVAVAFCTLSGISRRNAEPREIAAGSLGAVVGLGIAMSFTNSHMNDSSALTLLMFFLVLPIVNGCFDWLSWWATRALGRRLLASLASAYDGWRRGLAIAGYGLADLAVSVALLLGMAFGLAFGFSAYNEIAHWWPDAKPNLFDLAGHIDRAAATPWQDDFWLTTMLLTTLIPPFAHSLMLLASPLGVLFLPNAKRQTLAAELDGYIEGGHRHIDIARRAAFWVIFGQFGNFILVLPLLYWLVVRSAWIVLEFYKGGLAGIVAEVAKAGVGLAHVLLGSG